MALDNTTEVETPEHVRFRYRVAGPVRRMLAYLLDLLIRIGVLLVLWVIITIAFAATREAIQGFVLLTLFIMEWGYYVFFETTGDGRSPGKRVLSLRVVKEGGYPIGFIDSVLRNLLRSADFLPLGYVLGLMSMAADTRFRRLGDRVAGTMVVVEERGLVAAPLALHPPLAEGELDGFPQRPPLSAWERETLELFLRRADLTNARRDELAQTIATPLAQRMGMSTGTGIGSPAKNPTRFLALLHHRAAATGRPRGV